MTGFEPRTSRYIENDRSTNWATTALLIYYLLFKTDKSRHLYFFFGGGRGVSQVVSVLAFCTDDLSSNPGEVYRFYSM